MRTDVTALLLAGLMALPSCERNKRETPEYLPPDRNFVRVEAKNKVSEDPSQEYWRWCDALVVDSLGRIPAGPERLNRYGSLADGPLFAATGYFRTDKYKGRWIMVDPDGRMHIDASVNTVSPGKGLEQRSAFAAKYGSVTAWADAVCPELMSYGFNGAGAWSDDEAIRAYNSSSADRQMTYTPLLDVMSGFAQEKGYSTSSSDYPDRVIYVFDPDFREWCCDEIPKLVAPYVGDPNVVGYYSDNEIPLLGYSLDRYLALDEDDLGHIAAVRWMEGKGYGSVDYTVRNEFLEYVSEAYFSIVDSVLTANDPNHMYLGVRLSGTARNYSGVYAAAARHCDVVSMNYYGAWCVSDAEISNWETWADVPFMITEFYTKGEDSGLPNNSGDGWLVHTQRDRGYHYENFVIKLLRTNACVGWSWFKYQDNDPTAASTGSNVDSNKGVVSNGYEPWAELVESMRKVNAIRYGIMSQSWQD